MMRVQVTKRDVMNQNSFVIRVGYCDLQYLLRFKDSQFYTAGMYGWNADVYQVSSNVVIVTGYRPFGNVKVEFGILRGFEDRAKAILKDYSLKYEEQAEALDELLSEFLQVVLKMNE